MARLISKGTCSFCQTTLSKATMTRHLGTCQQRQAVIATTDKGKSRQIKLLHLIVEGYPPYWMHLEVCADATLKTLDAFLRSIWLECCGHMSQFFIDGEAYVSSAAREFDGRSMHVTLEKVLRPGVTFSYEYDFGTTTELRLQVVAERDEERQREAVQLLARNTPPVIPCMACGTEATHVCSQCIYEDAGWLCDTCVSTHACNDEMLLPVVNSPRVGMCGYEG